MTKLALLIGINYVGSNYELNGCINDINNMNNFLITSLGYQKDNIIMLRDDGQGNESPTYEHILKWIRAIIIKSQLNKDVTEIWIHYSGHGSYVRDLNHDEIDSRDETIIPSNFQSAGIITDDQIHEIFKKIPLSCRCIFICDSCHSGTIADLRYRYINSRHNVTENVRSRIQSNIISISGCLDNQTSQEMFSNDKIAGAMTNSLLQAMRQYNCQTTCYKLLQNMRHYLLINGYQQKPQICSSIILSEKSMFYDYPQVKKVKTRKTTHIVKKKK